MSDWRLRTKDQPGTVSEWPVEVIRQMLRTGVAGEQHEFLPPAETTWLSAFQAMRRLESVSDAPPSEGSAQDPSEQLAPARPQNPSLARRASEATPSPVKTGKRPRAVAVTKSAVVARSESPIASRPPRQRREMPAELDDEDELEMTPMIDMTFLLLIFFMITNSVTAMAQLQLPESHTGRAEKTEERVVLIVDFPEALSPDESRSLNGSKFILLANARLAFQDEPERPFAADQLEAELQRKFASRKASQFVLMVNRKMPVGVVRQVLKSASAAGAQETLVGVTMPR